MASSLIVAQSLDSDDTSSSMQDIKQQEKKRGSKRKHETEPEEEETQLLKKEKESITPVQLRIWLQRPHSIVLEDDVLEAIVEGGIDLSEQMHRTEAEDHDYKGATIGDIFIVLEFITEQLNAKVIVRAFDLKPELVQKIDWTTNSGAHWLSHSILVSTMLNGRYMDWSCRPDYFGTTMLTMISVKHGSKNPERGWNMIGLFGSIRGAKYLMDQSQPEADRDPVAIGQAVYLTDSDRCIESSVKRINEVKAFNGEKNIQRTWYAISMASNYLFQEVLKRDCKTGHLTETIILWDAIRSTGFDVNKEIRGPVNFVAEIYSGNDGFVKRPLSLLELICGEMGFNHLNGEDEYATTRFLNHVIPAVGTWALQKLIMNTPMLHTHISIRMIKCLDKLLEPTDADICDGFVTWAVKWMIDSQGVLSHAKRLRDGMADGIDKVLVKHKAYLQHKRAMSDLLLGAMDVSEDGKVKMSMMPKVLVSIVTDYLFLV